MRHRLLALLLAAGTLITLNDAMAEITQARATPARVHMTGSGNNTVSITWQVATTADHKSGASSPGGDFIDPGTGTIVGKSGRVLNAVGVGPYTIRERLTLDAGTVRVWIEQGLSRVVLERRFADPATGSSAAASVVVTLNRSLLQSSRDASSATLTVKTLQLEFDNGNNTQLVSTDESLRARLTATYTGSGILRGRWQIAEPGSSEGVPLYRTLALVNTSLMTSQRSTLQSPALPTDRVGNYLLRFCVTPATGDVTSGDAQCPDIDLVVTAAYFVQGQAQSSVGTIANLSPDRQAIGADDLFGWRPLPGTVVYRLQVFTQQAADGGLAASRVETETLTTRFVSGMLLNAETSRTKLTGLVRSKLQPGRQYLWRVTAHDESGRVIGVSSEASFVYQPDQTE
jgi:hypothetical protein